MSLTPTIVDEPLEFTVIATSPKEMESAQKSLILWAARKNEDLKQDIAEVDTQIAIALERRWNAAAWRAQARKLGHKAEFYRKIKAALEAGYYIVPPFPIDVFAIRTDRSRPELMESRHADNHDQKPKILPAGAGRYVDRKPIIAARTERRLKDGKEITESVYYAKSFKNPDFPFKLARAEIRDATEAAMKLGIFDALGSLPATRAPDPVICGQIIKPGQRSYYNSPRCITFFVAWWLNTADI